MSKIILLLELICCLFIISACPDDPPTAPEGASSDWDNSTSIGGTMVTYTCSSGKVLKVVCDVASLTWEPTSIICLHDRRGGSVAKGKKVKKGKKGNKAGNKKKKKSGKKPKRKRGKRPGGRKTQSCRCGIKQTSRIVIGQNAQEFDWPWIARLEMDINGWMTAHCSGSLIADQWILSSALCIDGRSPIDFKVYLGDHMRDGNDTNEKEYSVEQIISHEYYEYYDYYSDYSQIINDVALIKLSDKVDLKKYTPVCLPKVGTQYVGEMADLYGWGKTSTDSSRSTVLQESRVEVITNQACNDKFQEVNSEAELTENVICTYTEGTDACNGDFGGSLTFNDNGVHKQIGIVSSFADNECADGLPVVHTRVTEYLDWIKTETKANGGAVYCNK